MESLRYKDVYATVPIVNSSVYLSGGKMSDQYIGEIRNFGFNWAPVGWAKCDGQLLSISGNETLFSLLGTVYGGDGRVNFALPDLRGRVSINQGQGPGLENYPIGLTGGEEFVELATENLPSHSHELFASTTDADTDVPTGGTLSNTRSSLYGSPRTAAPVLDVELHPGTVSAVGGNDEVENRQPYEVTNFCIAVKGIFPPRQ